MKKNLSIAIIAALTLLLAGCTAAMDNAGSKEKLEVEEPMWAVLGSGVYSSREGIMFHGVGMANEYKNLSLLQAFSENRARVELEMVLNDFIADLSESFITSEKSLNSDAYSGRYMLGRELDAIGKTMLEDAEIVEGWLHPDGGKGYALMSVSLDKFMELIQKSDRLDKKFKSYVKKEASAVKDALNKLQVN